jgi:hypothetical protein
MSRHLQGDPMEHSQMGLGSGMGLGVGSGEEANNLSGVSFGVDFLFGTDLGSSIQFNSTLFKSST